MVWIVYHANLSPSTDPKVLISIASGLFILPFFLFSSIAGELAAKFEKTRLIRITKWWELGLVILAIVSSIFESLPAMISILFLLGVQSAFFGPMKYSILPQLMDKDSLLRANGWVELGTFLAILIGTLFGSLVVSFEHHMYYFSILMIIATLKGLMFSYQIPNTHPENPQQIVNYNFFWQTLIQMKELRQDPKMFWMIQMISWFWFLGIIILTLIPIIAKDVLLKGEESVSLLLTCMSLFIGVGSVACSSIAKRTKPILISVISGFVVTLFLFMLSQMQTLTGYVIVLSIFSFFCGLYSVPLYTFLQRESSLFLKSHLIAMLNIFNSLWMVFASIMLTFMLQKTTISTVFLFLGAASLVQNFLFVRIAKKHG